MTAKVLVGIVTHNRADILSRSVESALSQSYSEVRVAVIDDCSSDETPKLSCQFPLVDWTRWSDNRGYLVARNHWMSSSCADYFVSLDDDAWFLQGDEVSVAINVLEQNPQIAAVAFDILSPDRPKSVHRGNYRPSSLFIGCGHVLRMAALQRVGIYESSPGRYGGEEKDLSLRLMDAGYQIVLLPGVHVWHDKTPLARIIPEQHKSGVCNDLVITLRRTPVSLLAAAMATKLYRHLVFAHKNRLTRACLEGFVLFFLSIPVLWRSRRPVKASTLRAFIRLSQT